jgi:flavodoxin
LVSFTQNIYSQAHDLQYTQTQYNDNNYPCIKVVIEPSSDEAKDTWEDFIKDNYDVKMKGTGLFANKDVLYAEQVKFDAISSKEMDFYTRIVAQGDNTALCVFGSFGYDIPVSNKEYPADFEAMETIIKRFLESYLPSYYDERIKEMQDKLTDLQDNQKDMQDKMANNKKEIEKLTERNEELDKSLTENATEITKTIEKLSVKKENYLNVKNQLNSFDLSSNKK